MNATKEKILLLLLGGLAFGCSYTPRKQWKVLKSISKEWKKLEEKELRDGINELCRYDFINKNINKKGFMGLALTKKGKLRALNIQLDNIKAKKEKWDGKWRMLSFDMPEKHKAARDALRRRLKSIGFRELQKSIFVTPIDCKKELLSFIDLYNIKEYARFGVFEFIDNESYLRKCFNV